MRVVTGATERPDVRSCFQLEHAARCARAAELVYQEPRQIEQELRAGWGMREVEFFDVQDTQAVVAANDEWVVISFRGTEPDSLTDWITDASTDLVPGPLGGSVHAGFYDALANIWQSLDRFVAYLQQATERPLMVTGHSLGAALASLAVGRWLDERRPVHALYTFGQPRSGDATFARNFNFRFKLSTFRFVNNNDLVTRIPPRAFGYSHLGCFKYFTETGTFAEEIGWWERFLDGWRGRMEDVFSSLRDGVDDHSMREYRLRVEHAAAVEAAWRESRLPAIDRFLDTFTAQTDSQWTLRRAA